MPIHDWTRVDAGLYQSFRSSWIGALAHALNDGMLPHDCYALIAPAAVTTEEIIAAPGTIPFRMPWLEGPADDEMEFYRRRKSHVVIRRTGDHAAVAVLDIVSAGDKASRAAVRSYAERCAGLNRRGIHVLTCDVLPPGTYDPQGIHKAIWDEFVEEDFELPPDKPLTLAAYDAGPPRVAYVELVGVGDVLPEMPLFLKPKFYVPAPLETTYQAAWAVFPAPLKGLLQTPAANPPAEPS